MKKFALIALLAAGLATSASAAYTAGIELGYLTDSEEIYWSGRGGWEFSNTTTLSHQVELEIGSARDKESFGGGFSTRMKLIPVTVNYRAETTPANKLGFYFGAGLGQSRVSVKATVSGVPSVSDSDTAFAVQAFTGVNFKATPTVTLHAGVKYLRIDDVKIFGGTAEVGDDLIVSTGVSLRF